MNDRYVCNCGCPKYGHTSGGGCLTCFDCDRYDQTGQRVRGETDKQFAARLLKQAKQVKRRRTCI